MRPVSRLKDNESVNVSSCADQGYAVDTGDGATLKAPSAAASITCRVVLFLKSERILNNMMRRSRRDQCVGAFQTLKFIIFHDDPIESRIRQLCCAAICAPPVRVILLETQKDLSISCHLKTSSPVCSFKSLVSAVQRCRTTHEARARDGARQRIWLPSRPRRQKLYGGIAQPAGPAGNRAGRGACGLVLLG